MPPLNLTLLPLGERIQHELRVVDRLDKTTQTGQPYVVLTLGNATGQIDTEPIWSEKLDQGWADGAERGRIVQAIGDVALYRGTKRQLRITAPLRQVPLELARIEDFLPRVENDLGKLWDTVDAARQDVGSERLRRVLGLFFDDDAFRVRFERVPASISGHHSRLGGLLLHVCEVLHIARNIARTAPRASMDLVITGALLHDVGKTETYEVTPGGFVRTPCAYLIEHIVLGALMLERRLAALGEPLCSDTQLMELQHMILSHHGTLDFGSPVRPLTLEAEIVHWADEASAKANDFGESLDDPEGFTDGEQFAERKRLWRVDGRRIWRRGHEWD